MIQLQRSLSNVLFQVKSISRYFIFALAFFGGCIQPIDFATDYVGGYVVISGSVSNLREAQYLDIGITADTRRLPLPVNNAVAYLFDNAGGRIPYTFVGNGRYQLQDNFAGVPGDSYLIEVTLTDGRLFRSEPERMPEQAATLIASGQFKFEELTGIEGIATTRPVIDILADVTMPANDPLYLRWAMSEVYIRNPTDFPDVFNSIPPPCYISGEVDPQRLELFNGAENKSKELTNLLIGQRLVDKTFLEKHYIIVHQHSITAKAHDYWRKVDLLANRTGSIFDTPPAELLGNIKCITDPEQKVYGYFEAANTTLDRFAIYPSDLDIFIPPHCNYEPGKPLFLYEDECIDCLTLPNSTGLKPDWF